MFLDIYYKSCMSLIFKIFVNKIEDINELTELQFLCCLNNR